MHHEVPILTGVSTGGNGRVLLRPASDVNHARAHLHHGSPAIPLQACLPVEVTEVQQQEHLHHMSTIDGQACDVDTLVSLLGKLWGSKEPEKKTQHVAQKSGCNVVRCQPIHLTTGFREHPELWHHAQCINVEMRRPENVERGPSVHAWVNQHCQEKGTHNQVPHIKCVLRSLV